MPWLKARHRRRWQQRILGWLRGLGWASALVLMLALAIPWLVPGAWLEARSETELAARLGRPVDLEQVRLQLLPKPQVRAAGLSVGTLGNALLGGQGVRLYLAPLGMLWGQPLRHIELERLQLQPEPLVELGSGAMPGLDLPISAQALSWAGSESGPRPPLALRYRPGLDGAWEAELAVGEQRLQLRAEPEANGLRIQLEAPRWRLGPGLDLEALVGRLRLAPGEIQLQLLEARMGQGSLRFEGWLEQAEAWGLRGDLQLDRLPLQALLAQAGFPLLQGTASGALYLRGEAGQIADLGPALRLSGDLELGPGRLLGIDLETPARLLDGASHSGGETEFQRLALAIDGVEAHWALRITALESAVLTAEGLVELDPEPSLQGQLGVRLAQRPGTLVPLQLQGTPAAPETQLEPSAARAVRAGRSVLGDGVGGQAGLAASQAAERLEQWWKARDGAETQPAMQPEPQPVVVPAGTDTPWILDYE